MARGVPPEYMTPEQRADRILDLQHAINREWLRYAITEAIVIFVPFFAFLLVYVLTDAIPDSALMPAVIVFGIAIVPLLFYFLTQRIRPLRNELERLEALDHGA